MVDERICPDCHQLVPERPEDERGWTLTAPFDASSVTIWLWAHVNADGLPEHWTWSRQDAEALAFGLTTFIANFPTEHDPDARIREQLRHHLRHQRN